MANNIFISIPTYDNGTWTYTVFSTRNEFRDYIKTLFKEPGQYQFDNTTELFNQQARTYNKKKLFCEAPEGSKDYQEYWDTEAEKCKKGVIFIVGENQWYIPRDLYMWWNFLQISDKISGKVGFPEVWDVHYHIALYNILCQLFFRHSAILKKRQIGSSLYHMAKIINLLWFEEGQILKIGASVKDYINNDKGSWAILESYRNFLNKETAWYRSMAPDKSALMSWQQALEVKDNGRKSYEGNMSKLTGTSFEKNATAGVGGPCKLFFHEEAGIAPDMHTTFEFMRPALNMGEITTGLFIAAGSVGDLDDCEPLKDMILNPHASSIYAVHTTLLDEAGTEGWTGLFIPEQWSMPPYIDQYGNSKVEEALDAIKRIRHVWKYGDPKTGERPLTADKLQLRISQHPINIHEAFAIRTVSPFPAQYTVPQVNRIEDGKYLLEYVELHRGENNNITYEPSTKKPMEYPTDKGAEDKTGVGVMHERPIKDEKGEIPWLTYLASIDPVETGDSEHSESLAAIYVYKMPVEIIKNDGNEVTTFLEGGKLVFEWVGRYDDPNKTNEMLSKVCELYNAYAICEKNKPGFISYMQLKNRRKYLAKASDMIFDKEYEVTDGENFKAYGYTKTTSLWKKIIQYGINSLSENIGSEEKPKDGVERIPFIWLLKEMQSYQEGKNFDRIIAYCALMAFVNAQMSRGVLKKKIERTTTPLEDKKKFAELTNLLNNKNPFRQLGRNNNMSSGSLIPRKAFKHLR